MTSHARVVSTVSRRARAARPSRSSKSSMRSHYRVDAEVHNPDAQLVEPDHVNDGPWPRTALQTATIATESPRSGMASVRYHGVPLATKPRGLLRPAGTNGYSPAAAVRRVSAEQTWQRSTGSRKRLGG